MSVIRTAIVYILLPVAKHNFDHLYVIPQESGVAPNSEIKPKQNRKKFRQLRKTPVQVLMKKKERQREVYGLCLREPHEKQTNKIWLEMGCAEPQEKGEKSGKTQRQVKQLRGNKQQKEDCSKWGSK